MKKYGNRNFIVKPVALLIVIALVFSCAPEITVCVAHAAEQVEEIETMLASGSYAEGEVIAVVRADLAEEVNSGGFRWPWETESEENRLIEEGEVIAEASVETVETAIEEELPEAETVAEASADNLVVADVAEESATEIIFIKNSSMSTRNLMYALWNYDRVISVEPNYCFEIAAEGTEEKTEEPDTEEESAVMEPAEESEDSFTGENMNGNDTDTGETGTESEKAAQQSGESDEHSGGALYASAEQEESLNSTVESAAGEENMVYPAIIQENVFPVDTASGQYDLSSLQWGDSDTADQNTFRHVNSLSEGYNMGIPDWNEAGTQNATGVVAVLDTGVDYTNPDLDDVIVDNADQITGTGGPYGISFAADNPEGDADVMDLNGHGTHCAGIIASEWNGYGSSGVANGVKILAVQASRLKSFTSLSVLRGYGYL